MSDVKQIFDGVSGFSGFYKPNTDGADTAIRFMRGNASTVEKEADKWFQKSANVVKNRNLSQIKNNLNDGFLAQNYNVQWGRGVTMQRVLNKNNPNAMVGTGSGTLTIQGLLGTYAGFRSLLGLDGEYGTEDLCEPLNAMIACGNGFIACTTKGDKTVSEVATEGVGLILTNIIVANFSLQGQYDQNNILMQTGSVSFQIGGCKLQSIK